MLASPPVFVVADGMGGHAAGDVASRIAVEVFSALARQPRPSVSDALAAVDAANDCILEAARQDPAKAGMGTTLTGLVSVVVGGSAHWLVFNVGDSRVYRYIDDQLVQLTVDHSEVEEMVAAGHLSRSEARSYGRRNVVTRSLGTDPAPAVDSWVFPPGGDERFIVCSDGLTIEMDDEEIETHVRAVEKPEDLARDLVESAVAAGGRDNVTVIVIDDAVPAEPEVDGDTVPRPGSTR